MSWLQVLGLIVVFIVVFTVTFGFLMKRHIDRWNPTDE